MRRISSVLVLVALVAAGCAHRRAPAPRTEPPAAQPAPETGSPASAPDADADPSGHAAGTPPLDPTEVITAEELATIPDPVPGATAEAPVDPATPPPSTTPPPAGEDGRAWIWRVQIFASPDRGQAERTARDASERLREPYVLDREGTLYKVRLGAFATESEAEPLKRRAVLEGYTGAFRVRTESR